MFSDLIARYASNHPDDVDKELFGQRLSVCAVCPHRRENRCSANNSGMCSRMARVKAQECPKGLWPDRLGLSVSAETPSPGGHAAYTEEQPTTQATRTAIPQTPAATELPLSVVFLTPSLGAGGAERWIAGLVRWLPQVRGRPIRVAAVVCTGPDRDRAIVEDVKRYTRVLFRDQSTIRACDSLLYGADLVICWGIGPLDAVLPREADRKRPPLIWVAHGSCHWTAKLIAQARETGLVNHWVGVSQKTGEAFPIDLLDRLIVIHNGADPERALPIEGREATRARWGIQPGQKVVTYIGRLSPEKNVTALAKAAKNLDDTVCCVVVGTGWKEAETKRQCRDICGDRLLFVGHMDHVGDALAASDLWFNASPKEGFSLSLIEAWLAGVPVVSTPTGAIEEIQDVHGELTEWIGFDSPPENVARRIRNELTTEGYFHAERENRVALAQRVALRHFTTAAMAFRWASYLRSLAVPSANPAEPHAVTPIDPQPLEVAPSPRNVGDLPGCFQSVVSINQAL